MSSVYILIGSCLIIVIGLISGVFKKRPKNKVNTENSVIWTAELNNEEEDDKLQYLTEGVEVEFAPNLNEKAKRVEEQINKSNINIKKNRLL